MTLRTSHRDFRHLGAAAIAVALAAACVPAPLAPAVSVTVTGKLALHAGPGYRLRDVEAVVPYAADAVDHLAIFLRRGDGTEVRLGEHADLGAPIAIKNLRPDTAYTVRLEAYTADDARIDANADDEDGDTDAEGCETTFTTTTVQHMELDDGDAFQLRLAPKTYDGTGSGTLVLTPGGVGDAEEAIAAVDVTPDEGAEEPPPTPAGPLFDLRPVGGTQQAVVEGSDRRLTLADGRATQVYRSRSDAQIYAWVGQDNTTTFNLALKAWPVNGRIRMVHVSGTPAETGAFSPAILGRRYTRTSETEMTIQRWDGSAWIFDRLAPIAQPNETISLTSKIHDECYDSSEHYANLAHELTLPPAAFETPGNDLSAEAIAGRPFAFLIEFSNVGSEPVSFLVSAASTYARGVNIF